MRTPVRTPERPSPTRPCYHQAESLLLGSLRKSLTILRVSTTQTGANSAAAAPVRRRLAGVTRPSPRRCSGSRVALAAICVRFSRTAERSPSASRLGFDGPGAAAAGPGHARAAASDVGLRRTPPTRPRPVEAHRAAGFRASVRRRRIERRRAAAARRDGADDALAAAADAAAQAGMEPDARRRARAGRSRRGGADDAARRAADGAAGRGRGHFSRARTAPFILLNHTPVPVVIHVPRLRHLCSCNRKRPGWYSVITLWPLRPLLGLASSPPFP